jgi:hypothetical protein
MSDLDPLSSSVADPEMEFLNMNLTKESSLFNPCCSQSLPLADFKETHTVLFSGFKNPYKIIREKRKLESIHE